ncbi:MAG TPA: metallophosphoesterase [Candidatus Limnocylindria bacterium]|jgi:Icc-related predicted phosphoesterase|nr:metallophosphoesterase [Candidatus Limnocylindria bacterium]
MRILALSDVVDEAANADTARTRFGEVDLILGCGDLPYDYLDYVATVLTVPLYAVHGNHDVPPQQLDDPAIGQWWAGIDLNGRIVDIDGLLVGGFGGSRRYSHGPYQLSEFDMWGAILRMIPSLLANRLRRGRFLDVLVTHAPPRGIHDLPDPAHWGFGALRWFLRTFRPRYHLHGHSHVYDARTVTRTRYHDTIVVNAYGAREIEVDARR